MLALRNFSWTKLLLTYNTVLMRIFANKKFKMGFNTDLVDSTILYCDANFEF